MVCGVCGTRLGSGQSHCPNCGKSTRVPKIGGKQKPAPATPLAKARYAEADPDPDPDEVDVDVDVDELDLDDPSEDSGVQPARRPHGVAGLPEPAEVRALLASQPDLLEEGLTIFTSSKGKPAGIAYPTEVGKIDLLARDASGTLVVVMVGERKPTEQIVADILQRIGWVDKHMTKGKQKVRGLVVLGCPPENLGYAAAAVANTVSFKTYRLAIQFEDLEL